jgi:LPS-assembly lipoprotein
VRTPGHPSGAATRRRLLLVTAASALLAGCGFKLRQPPRLNFGTMAVTGLPPRSPVLEELQRQVAATGTTRLVESAATAEVVLDVRESTRERIAAAQSSAGQIREFTIRVRLRFMLRTPSGRVLIPDTQLVLQRDMSFNESDALAKEQEEATLARALQTDIVDQLMRQLAAVTP